jgi:hypothetical protein
VNLTGNLPQDALTFCDTLWTLQCAEQLIEIFLQSKCLGFDLLKKTATFLFRKRCGGRGGIGPPNNADEEH